MCVIGHHRVGTHVNGKHLDQFEDPDPDPVSPVGKIPPGLGIDPTQKLAPNAARDDVIVRRGVQRDQLTAGHGHGGLAQCGLEKQASGRPAA